MSTQHPTNTQHNQPTINLHQLKTITNQRLSKMIDNKKQTPSLMIPKSLQQFVHTNKYLDMLSSVLKYCFKFNELISKYNELKQMMSNRIGNTVMLQKQKDELQEMEKQLVQLIQDRQSYHYAVVLLENTSKSTYKDQFFFQTLIYLISRVVKQFFNRDQFNIIEECNSHIIKKQIGYLEPIDIIQLKKDISMINLLKIFPFSKLKIQPNKNQIEKIQKINALKQLQKLKKQSTSQPNNDYINALDIVETKDESQRSPLICSWLPSKKHMLNKYVHPNPKALNTISRGTYQI